MRTSTTSEIKRTLNMKTRKFFTLFSLLILSTISSFAQPAWFGGTPIVIPHVYSEDFQYGINQIGKVYVILINFNYAVPPPSSADIKNAAIVGPSGGRISTWVINVPVADINNVFTINALNQIGGNVDLLPNQDYTWYFVAEDAGGNLQASPVRIFMKTLPCPAIDIAFGYTQPQQCVNKGAMLQLNFFPGDPNPDLSGIYPGTKYFIDWGDGNNVTWLSTALLQIPPLPLRQHTYAATLLCNQEVIITVASSCNPLIVKQFKTAAILHGRDIAGDGDGNLLIVDNSTGLPTTIPVCEGSTHTITIKDMSIWDCQAPTFIDGSPAPPNTDPRTIQWLYGIDDGGTLQNTIGQTLGLTPNVVIGGANNAIRTIQGYTQPIISPAKYQGELSQTILIPAACRAGEIFNVYLRNWNKCNVYGVDAPVVTQIQILVVAAPALPIAPDVNLCFTNNPALSVLTAAHGIPAGNVLNWYANSDKTGFLGSGLTYNTGVSAVGTYTYYVADGQTSGNLCEGPTKPVVLTINPVIANNTVAAAQTICYNTAPLALTGSTPTGGSGVYAYQWQNSADNSTFNNIVGATGIGYAPPALTANTWYHRIVNSGPCSDISSSIKITITPTAAIASVSGTTPLCITGTAT